MDKIEWHPNGTPGPWALGSNRTYETALVGADGAVVADAAWTGGSGCELEIKNPINARAIAEVPAMVQALRDSLAFLRSGELDTRGGHIEASRIAGKFETILARIDGSAKA